MYIQQERRAALRAYFTTVVRDLVQRGVIRRQRGQSLEEIFRQESGIMIEEVQADLKAVLIEIGVPLLGGLSQMVAGAVQRQADRVLGAAIQGLGEMLAGKKR